MKTHSHTTPNIAGYNQSLPLCIYLTVKVLQNIIIIPAIITLGQSLLSCVYLQVSQEMLQINEKKKTKKHSNRVRSVNAVTLSFRQRTTQQIIIKARNAAHPLTYYF